MSPPIAICIFGDDGIPLGNVLISKETHASLAYDEPGLNFLRGHAGDNQFVMMNEQGVPQFVDKTRVPCSTDRLEITADVNDFCTISGLPDGVIAIYPGGSKEIATGGQVTFGIDITGVYTVTLRHPLYLTTQITIVAN